MRRQIAMLAGVADSFLVPDNHLGRASGAVPAWKAAADFLLVQVSFDLNRLFAWRETVGYSGKLLAGVLVVASSKMAQRIAADVPEIGVPEGLISDVERNPDAGVDLAVDMVERIRASGRFDGVHLVPVGRYADIAHRLGGGRPR